MEGCCAAARTPDMPEIFTMFNVHWQIANVLPAGMPHTGALRPSKWYLRLQIDMHVNTSTHAP